MGTKSWPIKSLRSRRPPCDEDRQTSEHVDDTLRQQASRSEAIGRLPANTSEDVITLPVYTSQDHHNRDYPAIVSALPKNMTTDSDILHEDARRLQIPPESESSPYYQDGSRSIELLPGPIATGHDVKSHDVVPIPTLTGAQQDPERSCSNMLTQESIRIDFTRDNEAGDIASEATSISTFIKDSEDYLSLSHGGEYVLKSISDTKCDPAPILQTPFSDEWAREHNSVQLEEPTVEGRSHSQSVSEKGQPYFPSLLAPNQVEISLSNTHLELEQKANGNLSSTKLNSLENLEPTSSQDDYLEPDVERDLKFKNLDYHLHSVYTPEMHDQNIPPPVSPHLSESVHEKDPPQPVSPKQSDESLTFDTRSRSRSFRTEKSLVVKGQERRRRREERRHKYLTRNLLNRAGAYKERARLRQLRFEVNSADEAFMILVRQRRVQDSQDDLALEKCYRRLQDARNEYGLCEDAYNETEEQLDREEFEAKELEEKLLSSDVLASGSDSDSNSSSTSENESRDSFIPNYPLYEKYVSKEWTAENFREKISDLAAEHERLLDSQKARRRVGRELAQEDQSTLQNYSSTKAKLLGQLAQIQAEVEELRVACIKEGLLDEYKCKAEEYEEILLPQSSVGSVISEEADYEKYHLLREKPQDEVEEKKSRVLLTDFIEGDVVDRITLWLLHRLRSSGLEIELLASYNDGLDRSADTEKWQEEVLNFWFIDSAKLQSSAYVGNPSFTATSPASLANLDGKHESNYGNLYHMQLIVRSSVLSRNLEFPIRLKLTRMNGRSVITE